MGVAWSCCPGSKEDLSEDQRVLASSPLVPATSTPPGPETSTPIDNTDAASDSDMGQIASQLKKLTTSSPAAETTKPDENNVALPTGPSSPVPSSNVPPETASLLRSVPATPSSTLGSPSSALGSPSSALATPRKPLSSVRARSTSDLSEPEAPAKRLKGDVEEYLNFPFLIDEKAITYIQNSKVMFIMKGIPGSGKSTIVKRIQAEYKDVVVCSADHFFMADGEYKFDPSLLRDAHDSSQTKAREAAINGVNVIVVDNTNVKNWEMKAYCGIARDHHYVTIIVEPQTPWAFDAHELALKNSHGVSEEIIARKINEYQSPRPIYYGWFLNEADSNSIMKIGREWLSHALELQEFCENISSYSGLSSKEEFLQYFKSNTFDNGSYRFHATAMFTARGKADGAMDYINDQVVYEALGQLSSLNVIGFVVTPRTFGARVKLTEDQLVLWGADDYEEPYPEEVNLDKLDNENGQPNEAEDPLPVVIEEMKAGTCQTTVTSVPQDLTNRFTPTLGIGSRAHLTLGCAPGVKPVATGFDAIKARELEEESMESGKDFAGKSFDLPGAVLRCYGEDTWVFYPENKLVVSTLFSSFN